MSRSNRSLSGLKNKAYLNESSTAPSPIDAVGLKTESSVLVAAQFPSRSDGNPYVNLLKASLGRMGIGSHEHSMYIGGRGRLPVNLSLDWLERHQGRVHLLHFHWLQKLYRGSNPQETEERLALLVEFLSTARRLGYRIAYTFHNLLPHEGAGADIDLHVRRLVIENADVLTCFSNLQRERIEEHFGPLPQLCVIPHPGYVGYYPDTVTKAEARRHLDIPSEARVFAFVGLIRHYKELPVLVSAFNAFERDDLYLIVAGSTLNAQKDTAFAQQLKDTARIRAHIHWIEESDMQIYMRAADILVLPYRQCWSSGVLMTAFSFGKTVVASDPLMLDTPTGLGIFHNGDDLSIALKEAVEISAERLRAMGDRGLAYAQAHTWKQAGQAYAKEYRKAYFGDDS